MSETTFFDKLQNLQTWRIKKHDFWYEWGRHATFVLFEKGNLHEIARSSDLDHSRRPQKPKSDFLLLEFSDLGVGGMGEAP